MGYGRRLEPSVTKTELRGAEGGLGGFVQSPAGTYTFIGTAAAAQTAIRGLIFTPVENRVAAGATEDTTLTITVNDGIASPVTDGTTVVRDAPVREGVSLSRRRE